MKKMNVKEFDNYRPQKNREKEFTIVISMGTCGIAAGGDKIYDYFEKEINYRAVKNVSLKKTGCLGMCFCEPNLIVKHKGKNDILYGDVDEETAGKILSEHIARGELVDNKVIFMPSVDIMEKGADNNEG